MTILEFRILEFNHSKFCAMGAITCFYVDDIHFVNCKKSLPIEYIFCCFVV